MNHRVKMKCLLAALLAAAGTAAQAQAAAPVFPSKAIVMVVPYAPGGSSDTRARQIAARMATYLGQPVVVDNKPGATGTSSASATWRR
jgi:tripartite-type tricarboxylate transporter receptor subunit TctC